MEKINSNPRSYLIFVVILLFISLASNSCNPIFNNSESDLSHEKLEVLDTIILQDENFPISFFKNDYLIRLPKEDLLEKNNFLIDSIRTFQEKDLSDNARWHLKNYLSIKNILEAHSEYLFLGFEDVDSLKNKWDFELNEARKRYPELELKNYIHDFSCELIVKGRASIIKDNQMLSTIIFGEIVIDERYGFRTFRVIMDINENLICKCPPYVIFN